MTNKHPDHAYYFSVGINDIPWSRLLHWYGRATDFPSLFNDILSGDPVKGLAAIETIAVNVEREREGIIMATPFAMIFLFRLLSFDPVNKEDILKQIYVIVDTTRNQWRQYEGERVQEEVKHPGEMLTDAFLFPAFISEEVDETLWDQYIIGNEHYYWLKFILEMVRCFSSVLKTCGELGEAIILTLE